jgi:hypothetical protein
MSGMTHMCLDIEGWLTNHPKDRDYVGMFKHDDGRSMSPQEARAELFRQLRLGRRVIPMSICDNFDYQNGCQGHSDAPSDVDAHNDVAEAANAAR